MDDIGEQYFRGEDSEEEDLDYRGEHPLWVITAEHSYL